MLGKVIATGNGDGENVPDVRFFVAWTGRYRYSGAVDACTIALCNCPTSRIVLVKYPQLQSQDRRLQLIHAAVCSEMLVQIFP